VFLYARIVERQAASRVATADYTLLTPSTRTAHHNVTSTIIHLRLPCSRSCASGKARPAATSTPACLRRSAPHLQVRLQGRGQRLEVFVDGLNDDRRIDFKVLMD